MGEFLKNPKVLFLIDSLQTGGTENSLLETVSRFRKIEPIIYYLFPRHDLREKFINAGIRIKCLEVGDKNLVSRIRTFNKFVSEERPKAIVTTLFKSDLVARLAHFFNGLPLVGTFVNDSYASSRYRSLNSWGKIKLRSYQFLDKLTSRVHHAFIANGENIRAANAEVLGINLRKIIVIYRGRDPDLFKPLVNRDLLKKKFLAIGRLIYRKGHADLLLAMEKVLKKYPDSTLTIAGDGPERSKLEKTCAKLGLQKYIQFAGTVQQVEVLLNESSFFVLPSHYEGFSGALIEAMLNEMPIIASAISMNQEAVSHLETAFLFEPGNCESLAQAMLWMIENSDKAKEMARKARQQAIQEFNIRKIADQYEEYLLSVVQN